MERERECRNSVGERQLGFVSWISSSHNVLFVFVDKEDHAPPLLEIIFILVKSNLISGAAIQFKSLILGKYDIHVYS